jgi:hypothetical protein
MFILDEFTVLMVTAITDVNYLKQHETHVVPKICMKYFTVTEHVNKNWCHNEIVALVS